MKLRKSNIGSTVEFEPGLAVFKLWGDGHLLNQSTVPLWWPCWAKDGSCVVRADSPRSYWPANVLAIAQFVMLGPTVNRGQHLPG